MAQPDSADFGAGRLGFGPADAILGFGLTPPDICCRQSTPRGNTQAISNPPADLTECSNESQFAPRGKLRSGCIFLKRFEDIILYVITNTYLCNYNIFPGRTLINCVVINTCYKELTS